MAAKKDKGGYRLAKMLIDSDQKGEIDQLIEDAKTDVNSRLALDLMVEGVGLLLSDESCDKLFPQIVRIWHKVIGEFGILIKIPDAEGGQ